VLIYQKQQGQTNMTKFRPFVIALIVLTLSFTAANCMAEGEGQQKQDSPFLITGKMPHLTKLLMQQWDNTALHLTDEQKTKLLVVRKETISGAQKLGEEMKPLENQVAEGSRSGKTPEELQSLVQSVAKLKADATMVHLLCIYNTRAILTKDQLKLLMTL
jgi:hypothetical protein